MATTVALARPVRKARPGEVSLAQLNTAIANTSSNSNAVAGLAGLYADPDAEELRQKVNELIAALRK
ncbi:MAG TPA: hypothetical protein VGO11_09975 [Chthoniobacteraceae bacterium]|jgi:hypothetical protein|nr:hypothetical protein [Chthoniobacteraceae bacterium]